MKRYSVCVVVALSIPACCNAEDSELLRRNIFQAWEQRVSESRMIHYEITATTKIFTDGKVTAELPDRVDIELNLNNGTFRREREREELSKNSAKKRLAGVATFDGHKVRNVVPSPRPKGKGEYAEVSGDLKQYQLDDFFPSILVDSGHLTLRPLHLLYYADYHLYKPTRDFDLLSPEIVQVGPRLRLSSAKFKVNDGESTLVQEIYCNPMKDFAVERIEIKLNGKIIKLHTLEYKREPFGWHVSSAAIARFQADRKVSERIESITVSLLSKEPDLNLDPMAGMKASRATFDPESAMGTPPKLEQNLVVNQSGELLPKNSMTKPRWKAYLAIFASITIMILVTYLVRNGLRKNSHNSEGNR